MALCYKDITFCIRDCKNTKCEINKKHAEAAPLYGLPVCFSNFEDCTKYEGGEK